MGQRKKWSASAKFEIALHAIKGNTTLNKICKRYEVAPSRVHAWKKQLLKEGAQLFGKAEKSVVLVADNERAQSALYEKIGQLTVERDFLKKAWSKSRGNNDGI